jgi:hypothetical protein
MDLHDRARRLIVRDPAGPFLHVLTCGAGEAFDLAWALAIEDARAVARIVRGRKCRGHAALFDEFAAAWQFPPYCGANWAALDECLADLEWLPARAYVLIVTDAAQLLTDEGPEAFAAFLDLVADVARERAGDPGEPGRSPASFHVVLHAEADDATALRHRLDEAGAAFDVL